MAAATWPARAGATETTYSARPFVWRATLRGGAAGGSAGLRRPVPLPPRPGSVCAGAGAGAGVASAATSPASNQRRVTSVLPIADLFHAFDQRRGGKARRGARQIVARHLPQTQGRGTADHLQPV